MSSTKVPSGLEHFLRLNRSVWFHQPNPTPPSSSNAPDFILLAAWMDASPKHIAKYTSGYEKLYPCARIIVVTTTSIDAAFRSNAVNLTRIDPALEILHSLPPDAKLLVHFFSNGGAWTMTLIATAYKAKFGKPLPISAMVMDSTPGKATYEATVQAFAVALPKNSVVKVLGITLLRLVYYSYMFGYWAMGKPNLTEQVRRDLNDKTLFVESAPRMYIYSVADEMVAWQFVEEHVDEARMLGYRVEKEKFLKSSHAAHLLSDSDRYWAIVRKLWGFVS